MNKTALANVKYSNIDLNTISFKAKIFIKNSLIFLYDEDLKMHLSNQITVLFM